MNRLLLLLIFASACVPLADEPPVVAEGPFIKAPKRTDACVNDLFFIDLPLEAAVEEIPARFAERLAESMTAVAQANVEWFCEPGRCEPLEAGHLVARTAHLFEARPGAAAERFIRLAFYYRPLLDEATPWAEARRLTVRDDLVCDAVAALHQAVATITEAPDHAFYVGRACTASGQQAAPEISPQMLSWHRDQMGVGDVQPARTPIALVDTGVRADLVSDVSPLAVPAEVLPAAFDAQGLGASSEPAASHPHGTEMAVLIRQITAAPIIDMPVLDANGRVPLGQVARAVDAVVATLGDDPAIINLSLGWAPEIERERKLIRGGCETGERPAGDAGPQPEHHGCDDCMIFVSLDDQTVRLQGVLSTTLPEGTSITNPWLMAYWPDGEKATLDLDDVDQIWGPGKSLDIAGLKIELNGLDLLKADVFLSTNIKTPTQTSATNDMSPLRVGEE